MNQPVQVSLVFPRSGQRLSIHVPSQIAQTLELRQSGSSPLHREAFAPSREAHRSHDRSSRAQ